jgi:hypothetical protein
VGDLERHIVQVGAADASMMQGDLPPSSSVVGVRLPAASSATLRPTAVDPVKNRWSNGSPQIRRHIGVTSTTANSSGAKWRATSSASSALVRGVISLGLSSTRLPAASAVAAGPSVSCSG